MVSTQPFVGSRTQQLQRLCRGALHDVSNPLSGSINCVRAMQLDLVPKADMSVYLQAIEAGLRQARRLADAVYRFAGPAEPESSAVAVADAIEMAHRLTRRPLKAAGIEVERAWRPSLILGGVTACLHVFVDCIEAITERASQGSVLRISTKSSARSTVVTLTTAGAAPDAPPFRPPVVAEVARLCARHDASAEWTPESNTVAITWRSVER